MNWDRVIWLSVAWGITFAFLIVGLAASPKTPETSLGLAVISALIGVIITLLGLLLLNACLRDES